MFDDRDAAPATGKHASVGAPFSFELFPPRGSATVQSLHPTIQLLADSGPDFISVTYGANGTSRDRSLELIRYVLESTTVEPMAHLTCVGSSSDEAGRLVREFLDAGVTSFLALRGDPPHDVDPGQDHLGDLRTASELVQLIHRVQAERSQFQTVGSRTTERLGRIPATRERVRVAVATFPNGHERDRRDDQDVDALLAKQTSGATMAITQLFFRAEDYLGFLDRARAGGVTIPIVPGVMPATTPGRLRRIVELTGEDLPTDLADSLERAGNAGEQFAIGVAHATRLARDVLVGGAPALHLYSFNQHRPVLSVLDRLGTLVSGARRGAP